MQVLYQLSYSPVFVTIIQRSSPIVKLFCPAFLIFPGGGLDSDQSRLLSRGIERINPPCLFEKVRSQPQQRSRHNSKKHGSLCNGDIYPR